MENILSKSYETQHFGFHPVAFFDDVYNTFYDDIQAAFNEMKNFFIQEYGNVITPAKISAGTEQLFGIMVKKLDAAIDKLEIYIDKNVFVIPAHVTLPEDEVHITHPCTKEDEEKLEEEIEQLKQRIQKERIHQYFVKQRITEQKSVSNELESFKKQLENMISALLQTKVNKDNIQETLQGFSQLLQKLKRPVQSTLDWDQENYL